jgi:phosphotransferase system enzyme I (PtsI)
MLVHGKSISHGVAHGTAYVLDVGEWLSAALSVTSHGTTEREFGRFDLAVTRAISQLERVSRQLRHQGRSDDADIFGGHSLMLASSDFRQRVLSRIRDHGASAEAAVATVVAELRDTFKASPQPFIQDKAADVLDIGRRVIQCLANESDREAHSSQIVVAPSLMPSEFVRLAHQGIAGVVTESCSMKSHTAILARGFGVPFVTGIAEAVSLIADGATVLLDATAGRVLVNPRDSERRLESELRQQIAESAARTEPAPTTTADGVPVQLLLNISDPLEARAVGQFSLAGVGLFRTEFLYMDRPTWLNEEDSFAAYQSVATSVGDGELHIRLADFGAEKCPAYADIPINKNPSLGIRGVRLLLDRDDILRPQVRALARVAERRPVTVLIPMVDTLDTLQAIRGKLVDACDLASGEPLPFKLAAMIEVPAAAMMIGDLIEYVDAVSVGLNDLTQYLLAADRDDELCERYHDALQPAVLRLLHQVIAAADAAGKPVTLCGELAGDASLTGVLLALGVRRFSVSRSHVPLVAKALREAAVEKLTPFATELLAQRRGQDVRAVVANRFR